MRTKRDIRRQAQKLFDSKKYDEVIELLTDEVLDKEKSAELYTQRAWAHNRLGESEKALDYVNKALNYNPQYAKAFRAMGVAFSDKMEYDKAIENYGEAIVLDPVNDVSFFNRGVAWLHKSEYEKAIEDFNRAIDINPGYANAFNNRAVVWMAKKEYDKAIEDCTKAIELDPKFSMAFNNRGNIWAYKGEFEKALLDYTIAIGQNYVPTYRNRGLLYDGCLKDYQKAIADYNKAIELDKVDNTDVIYSRDALLEKTKEQKQLQAIAPVGGGIAVEELGKQLVDTVEAVLKLAIAGKHETVAHYTVLSVVDKILTGKDQIDKDRQGRMRYYNAIYLNDPSEGRIIFECFAKDNKEAIQKAFDQGKPVHESSVYLGSFLTNSNAILQEDELQMWRTYGKDENLTEAASCSFVIDEAFFDKPDQPKIVVSTASGHLRQDGVLPPQMLYNTIYYKPGMYLNDENGDIKNEMASLEDILVKLITIQQAVKKEEDKRTIDTFIFNHLSRIMYLFKSADYAFEKEVRIIQRMSHGTELIRTDENYPPKLYVQSSKPLIPYLRKIIIGPEVKKTAHWITYLNLRIRQRGYDTPGKKEYAIEVRKSACTIP